MYLWFTKSKVLLDRLYAADFAREIDVPILILACAEWEWQESCCGCFQKPRKVAVISQSGAADLGNLWRV